MEKCFSEMEVRILRQNEEWRGTVRSLLRKGRHVLVVDVPIYIKDGTQRHKWKPKLCSFGNRAGLTILYDLDAWKARLEKVKNFRKAYKGARHVLAGLRDISNAHFTTLGIDSGVSYEDFKALRKRLMRLYHDDIVAQKLRGLPPEAHQALLQEAKRYTDALAFVDSYLKRRDT
ncbi:hypothetical protein KW797_03825 [Candidatus Parcubacteria bacterium]|nr:hypothetical protein [Candidatus Parcubacteria bacterium]